MMMTALYSLVQLYALLQVIIGVSTSAILAQLLPKGRFITTKRKEDCLCMVLFMYLIRKASH